MTERKNKPTLEDTFAMMLGDEYCDIHGVDCNAKSDGFGNTFYHCPLCKAESAAADVERIRKMNESIAFADFHTKTDA